MYTCYEHIVNAADRMHGLALLTDAKLQDDDIVAIEVFLWKLQISEKVFWTGDGFDFILFSKAVEATRWKRR